MLFLIIQPYRSLNSNDENNFSSKWNENINEPLAGFSWKHVCKADTNGVLIWSDIFLHDEANGEKIAIILIDTGQPIKPVTANSRIFGPINLISSVIIYNFKEEIQEMEIECLKMATDYDKFASESSQTVENEKPFQNLLFFIQTRSEIR